MHRPEPGRPRLGMSPVALRLGLFSLATVPACQARRAVGEKKQVQILDQSAGIMRGYCGNRLIMLVGRLRKRLTPGVGVVPDHGLALSFRPTCAPGQSQNREQAYTGRTASQTSHRQILYTSGKPAPGWRVNTCVRKVRLVAIIAAYSRWSTRNRPLRVIGRWLEAATRIRGRQDCRPSPDAGGSVRETVVKPPEVARTRPQITHHEVLDNAFSAATMRLCPRLLCFLRFCLLCKLAPHK